MSVERLEKILRYYQALLRLQDWDIKVEVDSEIDAPAEITYDTNFEEATIKVRDLKHPRVIFFLLHELSHILFAMNEEVGINKLVKLLMEIGDNLR